MGAYEASGVTVAEYCRREGLAASSFYLWRKQLARMDVDSSQGAKAKVKERPVKPAGPARLARRRNDNDPPGFVEVASMARGGSASFGVTISFPGDISIAAAPGCDVDLLRQAVMILSERSC